MKGKDLVQYARLSAEQRDSFLGTWLECLNGTYSVKVGVKAPASSFDAETWERLKRWDWAPEDGSPAPAGEPFQVST